MPSATGALGTALGIPLPDELESIPEDDAVRVASMIETARADQRRALDEAVHAGLQQIPRVLRGPIKKLLS